MYSIQQKPNQQKLPGNLKESGYMLFIASDSIFPPVIHAIAPFLYNILENHSQFKCSVNIYQGQPTFKQLSRHLQEKKNLVPNCYLT